MQTQLDDDGARRLVAAVILRAVEDTQRGDLDARAWLACEGELWCEGALNFRLDLGRMATGRPTGFERMSAALERNPIISDDDLAALTGLTIVTITDYRYLIRKRQRAGRAISPHPSEL